MMKIAVTTPTGNVGSAVADFLLEAGAEVRLLARRPEKLRHFIDRRAEVVRGSQDDPDYVNWTTHGVDALFWVTPPGYGSDDVRAYQTRFGRAAAEAIRANKIERVVNISAVGAHLASGVGVVNGLHDVEHILDDAAENVVHLRPGYFYENYFWQVDPIKTSNKIFLPVSGSRRYPMIATRDIARVATDLLMDMMWTGHVRRELQGPADLSFDEAAEAISRGLNRKVTHVHMQPDELRKHLVEHGMSENYTDLLLELYDAIETRRLLATEPRSPDTTTPTTLEQWTRKHLAPKVAEPVTH